MLDARNDRDVRIERALNERVNRRTRGIPHRNPDLPVPLSPVQQALWLTAKLEGGTATSRPSALRFRGHLDVAALEWALSELRRRHEVLRSTFPEVGGVPVQVPQDAGPITLPSTDLTLVPADRREGEAIRVAGALADEPFDLERETAFRPHLIRLDTEDHVLVVAMDHIVMDGWSERILHHEIRTLYDARLGGDGATRLPTPPIQYGDFAAWQAARLSDAALDRQLAYWRAELSDLPADLELPPDTDAVALDIVEPVCLDLPAPLVTDLRALGRAEQATPFMVLLAALDVLLAHLAGTEHLVVGVSTAGRSRPELEELLGCFINTLPIRAHVDSEATFREIVVQARERLVTGLANQDLPYSRLVAEFRPWGSADHRPLFQVSFQMRNFPELDTPLRPELEIVEFALNSGTMEHQLAIRAVEVGDAITVQVDFDSSRFRRSTIDRWAADLGDLLAVAVAEPDRPVRELPLPQTTPTSPSTRESGEAAAARPAGPLDPLAPSTRSPLLQTIAEVWAEVLDVDEVPEGAGFFEMGGHSLLAIRVMARLRDRLGVDLALVELFTNPTIEAFAAVVAEQVPDEIGGPEVPLITAEAVSTSEADVDAELEGLLAELQRLSDDEARALLAELGSDLEGA